MATDSVARRVAQKEIRLFFGSPVAWLFLLIFSAVCLFSFFWVESFFARNIADVRPLFETMPNLLVFLCAAMSMRMWSDERRNGTLEYILTQPVALWQFVLGKFLACLLLLLLALASTLPLPITVSLIANLDWGPVIGGYLAAILLGAAYLAIGLFVSARTDNAIVSLIGTVTLCGILNALGSPVLTNFLDNNTGEFLRLLSSSARFESVTRGVLDLGDLFYYLSLIVGFLALNVYSLEKQGWAKRARSPHHRHWRAGIALLLANLLLANIWLSQWSGSPRLDLTQGRQYSISSATTDLLDRLEEPLLIRGYFSRRTHPLLAPLVPQLRDLLAEYETTAGGSVRLEIIDPADDPAKEEEANRFYGIKPAPFQVADRHQSALVNAYFNILISYGDQQEVLGFSDLIEVRTAASGGAEIRLRNPEYDVSHAIKKVLFNYRSGNNLFDSIEEPVEFIGYVSNDALLPEPLSDYRKSITAQLDKAVQASGGKFSYRFIPPEARDGAIARQINSEWGFKPMATQLADEQSFYFYLTLADARQVVQLPTGNFDPTDFRLLLDTGLKRFSRGLTRTVALALPAVDAQMAEYHLGGPTFRQLERAVAHDYNLELEDLADGEVSPEADILAVLAPQQLDEISIFTIDQFLMRGGTVLLATSPFTSELSDGQLQLQDWHSGLTEWLGHHGIEIGESLVLDRQSALFPLPVIRREGDREFQEVQLINYPYMLDLRAPGLAPGHPATANLRQVTMAWASPITASPANGLRMTELLSSSANSWLSDAIDITPHLDEQGKAQFQPPAGQAMSGPHLVGLILQGRFESYFGESVAPGNSTDQAERLAISRHPTPMQHSPESARLVLFSSNDFADDQILAGSVTASGTQYLGPLELLTNTLSWALRDDQLLAISHRAHFNRTLPPMERRVQQRLEYVNYGLSLLWLLALAMVTRLLQVLRKRRYRRELCP